MAAVVRSVGGPRRPATRSMYSQTDLTWPSHLQEPAFLSSSVCTSSYTQTDTPVSKADQHTAVKELGVLPTAQSSPKPGCSIEGHAPSKPPRGSRSSPGLHVKQNKPSKPRLNCPPKDNSVNIHNCYDVLSDMKDDVYTNCLYTTFANKTYCSAVRLSQNVPVKRF